MLMNRDEKNLLVLSRIQNEKVKTWLKYKLGKHPALHLHEYKERGRTAVVSFTFDAPIRNLSPMSSEITHLDFNHSHGRKAFEFNTVLEAEKTYKA